MSPRIQLLALSIVAFVSFAAHVSHAQTPKNSGADETAIRQIVQQLEDGWNAHDGKAFAAPFAADADYVIVNGTKIKGREAIEEGHIGIFMTIYKDSHLANTIKVTRFLRPDVAIVHVGGSLEVRTGDKSEKSQAMMTLVMTKEGGKWTIAAFQNTPIKVAGR